MAGVVTLSLEIELGWSKHDLAEYSHLSSNAIREKETLTKLLDLCERLEIPITFNIVGHLFEDCCTGFHDGAYPDAWWTEDPGTNKELDPLFYNPEIVTMIKNSTIDHEVATHTYSHIYCEEVPEETLATELNRVKTIHSEWGLTPPSSIVFPKHQTKYYNTLRKNSIKTVRRSISNYEPTNQNRIEKFYWLLTRPHPMTNIEIKDGILETYCTPHPSLTATYLPNGQRPPHSAFQMIPLRIRQRLLRQYIKSSVDQTAQQEEYIHLWTHLHNLSNQYQWPPVYNGLNHVAKRRDQGKIKLLRMCDLQTAKTE